MFGNGDDQSRDGGQCSLRSSDIKRDRFDHNEVLTLLKRLPIFIAAVSIKIWRLSIFDDKLEWLKY